MTRPERRPVHAYIPTASHDFAATNGASVSALLDALGRRLAAGETRFDLKLIAKQAIQIDVANRRRRP